MDDPKATVTSLSADLPELETTLEALLEKPWAETVEKLSPLDRAKMDTMLAYAINDLVWVYMKMKGVNPEDHEVSKELDRVRTYYTKVKQAEEPGARRSMTIDQAAAKRIVTASIPPAQRKAATASTNEAETSAAARARAEHEKAVAEQLERVGMSNRFRFVGGEAEKVAPAGDGEAQREADGMQVVDAEDVMMDAEDTAEDKDGTDDEEEEELEEEEEQLEVG